jgi:hypothetical protein
MIFALGEATMDPEDEFENRFGGDGVVGLRRVLLRIG